MMKLTNAQQLTISFTGRKPYNENMTNGHKSIVRTYGGEINENTKGKRHP